MKINVLRLIEDALIGGKNGEMAFIENNPLIANLYSEFVRNSEDGSFKAFLLDCLNDETRQDNNSFKKREEIIKEISINANSEEYREYKKQVEILNSQQKNVNEALRNIAISTNKTLATLTNNYELKFSEWNIFVKYKIDLKVIKES